MSFEHSVSDLREFFIKVASKDNLRVSDVGFYMQAVMLTVRRGIKLQDLSLIQQQDLQLIYGMKQQMVMREGDHSQGHRLFRKGEKFRGNGKKVTSIDYNVPRGILTLNWVNTINGNCTASFRVTKVDI